MEPQSEASGMGVDASGGPVIDPTRNVLDKVTDAITRLDDLRAAQSELTLVRHKHLREVVDLRAKERNSDIRHVREIQKLCSKHINEMRKAEALRIDAIREVDNQAVQQAATVSATQATTLANQVTQAAEAMRVQVAATATASATALANALEPIVKAIAELQRAQYETQGKTSSVVDTTAAARSSLALWIAGLAVFVTLMATVATIIIQIVK